MHEAFKLFMSVEDAAKIWGLSAGTVKNYCREGIVIAHKYSRDWIILRDQPTPAKPEHPKNWRGKKRNDEYKEE